jgi:hypothetical protein
MNLTNDDATSASPLLAADGTRGAICREGPKADIILAAI